MAEVKRPVIFCGENPGITLFASGEERATVVASYWNCVDSQWGCGHALVLWLAPENGFAGIYTDNPAMARGLVDTLTRFFPEFEKDPIHTLPLRAAVCGHIYDGACYQVRCQSDGVSIELTWSEILDRKQLLWPGFPAGENAFDLTTVICPCRAAGVAINGQAVPGEVQVSRTENGVYSSSAFLAFSETWVGPVKTPAQN